MRICSSNLCSFNEGLNEYDFLYLKKRLLKSGYDFFYKKKVISTMNYSGRKLGDSPLLVLADHQSGGRGRYNNKWKDEKGKTILITLYENKTQFKGASINLLSNLFILQTCIVLNRILGKVKVKIKWPNDLMSDGEKISGILVEETDKEIILIGIGINVYQGDYSIGYLKKHQDSFLYREKIITSILEEWSFLKKDIQNKSILEVEKKYSKLWHENQYAINKKVFCNLKNGPIIGEVIRHSLDGTLSLISDRKKVLISKKDYVPGSFVMIKKGES